MKIVFWLILALILVACAAPKIAATPTVTPEVLPTIAVATATNTVTPFVPETPTEIPTVVPTPDGTYTVQAGDTLIGIADKFGISYGYLADVNGIDNPSLISIGQVLIIPVWPPAPDTISDKLIVVSLSEQKVYVYENGELINTFVVSTGVAEHPTVTGHYNIYVKLVKTRMTGEGYDLSNVPWTMYFFEGYGFHGTYWHSNFGTPMSHGCVNMYTPDAEWLFNWADVGTPVTIYP